MICPLFAGQDAIADGLGVALIEVDVEDPDKDVPKADETEADEAASEGVEPEVLELAGPTIEELAVELVSCKGVVEDGLRPELTRTPATSPAVPEAKVDPAVL